MAGLVRGAMIVGAIAWFSPLHGEADMAAANDATLRAQIPSIVAGASGLAETRQALPPEARAALDRMIAEAALTAVRQAVPRP
jgi:hypothetical protein